MPKVLVIDDEHSLFQHLQEHGGTISVDCEPGKGTAFTIRLPREQQVDFEEDIAKK